MAARENQGYQIALIIFVMLTIVLTVTTFYFVRSYQSEQEKSRGLTADKDKAVGDAAKAQRESQVYREMIAGSTTDSEEVFAAATKKDLETHGKTLAEGKQSYRELVKFLATELSSANTRIAELTLQKKELADQIQTDLAAKNAEIAKYTENLSAAAKELEDERTKFNGDRKKITGDSDQLARKFDEKRKQFDDLSKKSGSQISALTTTNSKLTALLKAINDERTRGEVANESPDGEISWVDQRARLVWVNLGSDDGLRRQTTFSVYGGESAARADAPTKGKIEVVRLIGPHMAEARIIDDDLSDPMMPRDQIFSPVWEPGRPEHFALAGFMDMDGDGENDRQRVRDLIALNGGVIDEEVGDDGKSRGEMSINTKYLVLGDKPKIGENASKDSSLTGWSDINGEARTLGVKTIPLREFLKYMGWKAEDRTVELGARAKPTDFQPRLPEGIQRIRPSESKERRKPARATQGRKEN